MEGEEWRAEVGQPLAQPDAPASRTAIWPKGIEIRVIGEPAADVSEKRVKVERLFLGKREYVLYPERD